MCERESVFVCGSSAAAPGPQPVRRCTGYGRKWLKPRPEYGLDWLICSQFEIDSHGGAGGVADALPSEQVVSPSVAAPGPQPVRRRTYYDWQWLKSTPESENGSSQGQNLKMAQVKARIWS